MFIFTADTLLCYSSVIHILQCICRYTEKVQCIQCKTRPRLHHTAIITFTVSASATGCMRIMECCIGLADNISRKSMLFAEKYVRCFLAEPESHANWTNVEKLKSLQWTTGNGFARDARRATALSNIYVHLRRQQKVFTVSYKFHSSFITSSNISVMCQKVCSLTTASNECDTLKHLLILCEILNKQIFVRKQINVLLLCHSNAGNILFFL